MTRSDVFVSYHQKSMGEFCRSLVDWLRAQGFSCWFDEYELLASQKLDHKISDAIRSHRFFIAILNSDYITSPSCQDEMRTALELEKNDSSYKIIPLLLDGETRVLEFIPELKNKVFIPISHQVSQTTFSRIVAQLKELEPTYHVLLERGPTFTETLRNELRNIIMPLGKYIDHLAESEKRDLTNYREGLERFIGDPFAQWLITVFPEHVLSELHSYDRSIFEDLVKLNKQIIFIESGHSIYKMATANENADVKRIHLIQIDHENAMDQLLETIEHDLLSNMSRIHFVLLPGPTRFSQASVRYEKQIDFLSKVALKCPENELGRRIVEVNSTILPCKTWTRREARELIEDHWAIRDLNNPNVHRCFICGNDEMALGVLDAISRFNGDDATEKLNFSIFGYDGNVEFMNRLENGITGGTVEFSYGDIARKVENIIQRTKKGIYRYSESSALSTKRFVRVGR